LQGNCFSFSACYWWSNSIYQQCSQEKKPQKLKKIRRDRFKHNVEKLFSQICGDDIRSIYVSKGFFIPDYKIIVNREKYLDITKSKLQHLVDILQYFDHNARCTLVDLVPNELGKDLLREMDQEMTSPSSSSDDNDDEEKTVSS
jgi:hypothetical protein